MKIEGFQYIPKSDTPAENLRVSSLRLVKTEKEWTITIFSRGMWAGSIIVEPRDGEHFLNALLGHPIKEWNSFPIGKGDKI